MLISFSCKAHSNQCNDCMKCENQSCSCCREGWLFAGYSIPKSNFFSAPHKSLSETLFTRNQCAGSSGRNTWYKIKVNYISVTTIDSSVHCNIPNSLMDVNSTYKILKRPRRSFIEGLTHFMTTNSPGMVWQMELKSFMHFVRHFSCNRPVWSKSQDIKSSKARNKGLSFRFFCSEDKFLRTNLCRRSTVLIICFNVPVLMHLSALHPRDSINLFKIVN